MDRMREMQDNSISALISDPPYNLSSSGSTNPGRKAWAYFKPTDTSEPIPEGKSRRKRKPAEVRGFLGLRWDDEIAFKREFWLEIYRVLIPNGIVKVFSGTRTYHRMVLVMEETGFAIDGLNGFGYGSGMPKSLSMGKSLDKLDGVNENIVLEIQTHIRQKREAVGLSKSEVDSIVFGGSTRYSWVEGRGGHYANYLPTPDEWMRLKSVLLLDSRYDEYIKKTIPEREFRHRADGGRALTVSEEQGDYGYRENKIRWDKAYRKTAPSTEAAKQWDGWGTGLKPAWEPIIIAHKPLT